VVGEGVGGRRGSVYKVCSGVEDAGRENGVPNGVGIQRTAEGSHGRCAGNVWGGGGVGAKGGVRTYSSHVRRRRREEQRM